jgi:hypothetical protein
VQEQKPTRASLWGLEGGKANPLISNQKMILILMLKSVVVYVLVA